MNEADLYRTRGAALIQRMLPPEVASALAYQISLQVRAAGDQCLAPPVLSTKACYEIYAYQWPVLLTFLWGMTPRLEHLVGKPLLPTYCYFRTYQQGDICKIHADRPACEHSLSLTLAYSDDLAWALAVSDAPVPANARATRGNADFGGAPYTEFAMAAGDAVLYRGTEHYHGRLVPNPNRWSAHLFLHWVERDGACSDHAFDRRIVSGPIDFAFPS